MFDNLVYDLDNHIDDPRGAQVMPLIPQSETRRTETPNAVMTTLASPTQGGAEHSVWRVEMAPGASGPAHAFDAQQVWTAVAGAATVELDGEALAVAAGDTLVLPSQAPRRIVADSAAGFTAIVAGSSAGRATLTDGTDRGIPPWIA
jgi:quercetin dioxygenase-like cupin family protein